MNSPIPASATIVGSHHGVLKSSSFMKRATPDAIHITRSNPSTFPTAASDNDAEAWAFPCVARYSRAPMTASIDTSLRFVLPDGAPFVANLAALWATEPALAEAIELLREDARHRVEPSKVPNTPTVAVAAANGRPLYLHSKYQPIDEAKRMT